MSQLLFYTTNKFNESNIGPIEENLYVFIVYIVVMQRFGNLKIGSVFVFFFPKPQFQFSVFKKSKKEKISTEKPKPKLQFRFLASV